MQPWSPTQQRRKHTRTGRTPESERQHILASLLGRERETEDRISTLVSQLASVFSAITITQRVTRKTAFTANVSPWVHITEPREGHSGEKAVILHEFLQY